MVKEKHLFVEDDIMAEKQTEEKKLIGYKDLTLSLKILIAIGWVIVAINVLAFFVGFVIGFMGY